MAGKETDMEIVSGNIEKIPERGRTDTATRIQIILR